MQTGKREADPYFLGPKERYLAFIEAATSAGEVWGMWVLESWMVRADPENNDLTLFLLWPSEAYARRSMQDHPDQFADGAKPEAIPIDRWLSRYTLALIDRGARPCVFPDQRFEGVCVVPSELARDLERALRAKDDVVLQERGLVALKRKVQKNTAKSKSK